MKVRDLFYVMAEGTYILVDSYNLQDVYNEVMNSTIKEVEVAKSGTVLITTVEGEQ